MRIGELLVEASVIDAKALEKALEYALDKKVPVGRALRALRYLEEPSLHRGLDAQRALRKGLDTKLTIEVLHYAEQTNRNFLDALRGYPGAMKHRIPPGFVESLAGGELEQTKVRVDPSPPSKPAAAAVPAPPKAAKAAAPAPTAAPTPAVKPAAPAPKPAKPPDELIKEGDRLLAGNNCVAAEKSYELARRLLEENPQPDVLKLADVLLKLGHVLSASEKLKDAEPYYIKALELQASTLGSNCLEVATTLSHIGDTKIALGQREKARAFIEKSLAIMEEGQFDYIPVLGRLFSKLASCYDTGGAEQRNRVGELATDAGLMKEEDLNSCLTESERTGQPLGVVMRSQKRLNTQQVESLMYAQLLIKQGVVSQLVAVRALRLACGIRVPLRQIAESAQWVTTASTADEQYKTQVFEQERLVAAETTLGPDHPELVPIIVRLGDIYNSRKDRLNAELHYRRAFGILDKWECDARQMMRVCEKLATAYCQQAKYGLAQPLLAKALDLRKTNGQGETVDAAKCVWLMGKVELLMLNHATALSFLQSAREMFGRLNAPCPRQLLEDLVVCINETATQHDLPSVLEELISLLEGSQGARLTAAGYMEQLGDHYLRNGQKEAAREWFSKALDIHETAREDFERIQTLKRKVTELSVLI